jgi:hypothetical protein
MGPTILERKPVPTQKVTNSPPKRLRDNAIMQVLTPDHVEPNPSIPQETLRLLKALADAELNTKIPLLAQFRIISDQMDPRIRTLPVTPHMSETTAYMKHASVQWVLFQ